MTVRDNILDRSLGHKADDLTPTVMLLFSDMLSDWFTLDLSDLPVDQVNSIQLCVVLRATWSRKDLVKGWDAALEVAKAAVIRDGYTLDDALGGLL